MGIVVLEKKYVMVENRGLRFFLINVVGRFSSDYIKRRLVIVGSRWLICIVFYRSGVVLKDVGYVREVF